MGITDDHQHVQFLMLVRIRLGFSVHKSIYELFNNVICKLCSQKLCPNWSPSQAVSPVFAKVPTIQNTMRFTRSSLTRAGYGRVRRCTNQCEFGGLWGLCTRR